MLQLPSHDWCHLQDHDEVIKDLQREKQLCEEYQEECNDASTQASFYAKWSSDANEVGSLPAPFLGTPSVTPGMPQRSACHRECRLFRSDMAMHADLSAALTSC